MEDVVVVEQGLRRIVQDQPLCVPYALMIDSGFLASVGGVPQEQKMLKGHLPRVIYHQVYEMQRLTVSHSQILNGKFSQEVNAGGFEADCRPIADFIQKTIFDKYSGSMKITAQLYHISRCEAVCGTNWSNRWTYRVFVVNTRPE